MWFRDSVVVLNSQNHSINVSSPRFLNIPLCLHSILNKNSLYFCLTIKITNKAN